MRTLIERIAAGESTAEDAALVQAVLDAANDIPVDQDGHVPIESLISLLDALEKLEEAVQ